MRKARRHRGAARSWRRGFAAACLLTACLASARDAQAAEPRLTVAPLTGAIVFDEDLGDFSWARGPHAVWGAEATARFGRFEAGTRWWVTGTTQEAGTLADESTTDVRMSAVQMTGGFTLLRMASTSLGVVASAGHLAMRYDPSFVEIAIAGTNETVRVDFAPIDEWIGGAGLSLTQGVGGRLLLRGEVESVFFSLDTTHRSGDVIVDERSRFQNWIVRASLSYRLL